MAKLLQPKRLVLAFALFISAEYAIFPFLHNHSSLVLAIESVPYLFSCFALRHVAASRREGFRRRFWTLMSWASVCYALAQWSWIFYDLLLNEEAPIFSVGDLFWNLQSILYLVALIYLLGKERGAYRGIRLLFDAVIFVAIAAVMSWEFIIHPHLSHLLADSGWWGVASAASYPIADVAIVGCLFVLHINSYPKAVFLPFFSGFILYIIADTVYLKQLSSNAYRIGSWSDPLYSATALLILLAAVHASGIEDKPVDKPIDTKASSNARYALTYGSLFVLLAVMLRQLNTFNMGIVFYASLGILVLIIIRQVTVLVENDDLLRRLQHMLERTRTLAFYDQLSLLPNRRFFEMKAKDALERAELSQDKGRKLAVLFMDLDRFKYVNDSYGHDAGDALIQTVTQRLKALADDRRFVARMGGDEFTMLCSDIGSERELRRLAEDILKAVGQPIRLEPGEFFTTASIGIAVYPKDGTTIASLLRNADTALYKAKALGKNRFVFYTEQFSQDLASRITLENELRRALERKELTLYYQPQIEASSGRLAGVEALIRWRKQPDVMISPAAFIPVAEESGLIVPIGQWILRTACRQAKRWMEAGFASIQISVNVSPRQLIEANFVPSVVSILKSTGLPPERLVLEITESIAMENEEETVEKLHALKRIGVRISMDDFGTGYSSLGYLKRFQVDELKIAQTFISEIYADSDKASIVKAILAMAGSLKLKVIAEGVETEEQYLFLREQGCDWIQGYYFHKPLSSEEMERLLAGQAASDGP